MISRAPLKVVKAKYRESDKRKLLTACNEMSALSYNTDDIEFHNKLEEIKALIRRAEANAEIHYSSYRS